MQDNQRAAVHAELGRCFADASWWRCATSACQGTARSWRAICAGEIRGAAASCRRRRRGSKCPFCGI